MLLHGQYMTDDVYNQALSAEELAELEAALRKEELDKRILEKNIQIKRDSGYFGVAERNHAIDQWRKKEAGAYAKKRRETREKEAEEEGRTLRSYEPATPERRKEQVRLSKAKARLDPDYAALEREANTIARKAKRDAMTPEERDEANRIRREKRAAKKKALGAS